MCHQCTELPNGKYKKRKLPVKQKQVQYKNAEERPPNQYKKSFALDWVTKAKIDVTSVEIPLILKGFSAQKKLYKPLFPEDPAKASHLQVQETQSTSVGDTINDKRYFPK